MTGIYAVALVASFAAGSILRDGWPALGTTHGARTCGAILCALGAYPSLGPEMTATIGIGVLASFYFDMKHGEGQGADTPESFGWLTLSGITSAMPIAAALALWTGHPVALAIIGAGFLKPGIWWLAWRFLRPYQQTWFQPTRIAAGIFGGVLGAVTAIILGALP